MKNIRALFNLPTFADPEQDHRAQLLNRLVWLTVGTFAVMWIVVLLFDPADADRASRSFIIPATLSMVIIVLLHRRHLGAASLLFVAEYWVVVTAAVLSGGGLATPAAAGFPLVALAAGLIIGWRAGLLSSLVCVITMMALAYAESNHLLPSFTGSRTPLTYLIVDILILCLIIVFVYFYTLQIKTALLAARRELDERIQAERALQESEERFRAAFMTGADALVILEEDTGLILEANDQALELYGYSREEAIGHTTTELGMWAFPEARANLLAEIQKHDRVKNYELLAQRKNGEQFWILYSVSRMGNGDRRLLFGAIRDMSEIKRTEEQLRILNTELEQRVTERTLELEKANRAKDEFLANMSHELRSPLSAILGLSETLLEQHRGPLNESQQRSVQLIESSGQHLLELINDILDLSKIEAGKFDYYPEVISIDATCNSSLAFIRGQATKKAISIHYSNESGISTIHADPRRLKQILVNLLTNAVKFTPEKGHVSLEVTFDLENNLVQLSVSDDGIGISPADIEKLFQRFVQVDSQLNRGYEGTGLGLALVQKLTDLHGGTVQVESRTGKGSRFTISLPHTKEPAAKTEPAVPAANLEKLVDHPTAPSQGSVLLADDHPANISMISDYLEAQGFEVRAAKNGFEAIALAEADPPDLILMDIQMPVLDGLEATRRLRANPRFASIPIIVLTALVMPGDRQKCLDAGATDYMSKPVNLKKLAKTVEEYIRIGRHSASFG